MRARRLRLSRGERLRRVSALRPSIAVAGFAASVLVLTALAVRIRDGRPPLWDGAVLAFLGPDRYGEPLRSTLDVFMAIGGEYRGLVFAVLLIAVLVALRRPRAALLSTAGVGATIATVVALEPAFERPALIAGHQGYFPSGHAAGSLAVAGVLALVAWRTRWRWLVVTGGIVFVALYGAALVYFRSHYPSDVVAGWCIAAAWTCVAAQLVPRREAHSGR
jgi:membrane-associated phospholipid phosphatase